MSSPTCIRNSMYQVDMYDYNIQNCVQARINWPHQPTVASCELVNANCGKVMHSHDGRGSWTTHTLHGALARTKGIVLPSSFCVVCPLCVLRTEPSIINAQEWSV